MRTNRKRIAPAGITACMIGAALLGWPLDGESQGARGVHIGLAIGAGSYDAMSVADFRPVSRGQPIAAAEILFGLGESWRVGAAYQIGGSWFDYRQPFATSGNIKDQRWLVRARVDRWWGCNESTAITLGLGAEYGEARSWTDTRFVTEEGPRAFMTGGSIRAGLNHRIFERVRVFGELDFSIFHSHATHGATGGDYNWVGRSTSIVVGSTIRVF